MVKQILLVGLGGGIGSIARYLISVLGGKYYSMFPLATFVVNLAGCFLIGILIGILDQGIPANQNLKLLFITGFCGGFTTFSTFVSENLTLLQSNHYGTAIFYIGLSILTGLFAVWLGLILVKQI